MPLLPKTKSSRVFDMLSRLEDQMRKMRSDIDSRLDLMTETFESRRADDEAEALAAERIRNGAAERTQDGAEALSQLGIRPH
jgi:hypothetical protein